MLLMMLKIASKLYSPHVL